jgi:hypothetical protein
MCTAPHEHVSASAFCSEIFTRQQRNARPLRHNLSLSTSELLEKYKTPTSSTTTGAPPTHPQKPRTPLSLSLSLSVLLLPCFSPNAYDALLLAAPAAAAVLVYQHF